MKAEQRFDLVAEANFNPCETECGFLACPVSGDVCGRHFFDGIDGNYHYDIVGRLTIPTNRWYGVMWSDGYHWGDS